MKRKACKQCKMFVEGDVCPACKGNNFSTNWQGRIYVVDPSKSVIAKKIGIEVKGEYAIGIMLPYNITTVNLVFIDINPDYS